MIDSSGHIKFPSVGDGVEGGCQEEAIRIVSLMPPWQPAKNNGKPVSLRYTIPVKFSIAEAREQKRKAAAQQDRFESSISSRIKDIVRDNYTRDRMVTNNYAQTNLLTIKFMVNGDGKPGDFLCVTTWGRQFYDIIVPAIEDMEFASSTQPKYFHFYLEFNDNGYRTGLRFSDSRYASDW